MITVQVESFEQALPELKPLFDVHWRDLALFQNRMPLSPQYDEYVRREREGRLMLVTVRRDGAVVAYYTAQIAPGFHYGTTLTAHMDMMYVVPEIKGRGLARPLMRCVERELRRRGVKVWYSGWKSHKPQGMDRLHELLEFEPADVYRVKWLGD